MADLPWTVKTIGVLLMIMVVVAQIILIIVVSVMALSVLLSAIFGSAANGDLVQDVNNRFGITITRAQADMLNDHRSGAQENLLRVNGSQVLVKVQGQPVQLRTLS